MVQIITNNSGGGGGGGGASYTAGNGIDITSNEISIDEAVVQTVGNMVDNLTGADDDHYPTAKAVADAISGGGSGDVIGPASSTDGDIVLFDGATGKAIKDSGVGLSSKLDASALSNNNYGGAWQGDSTHTPTKGVLYDKIHTMDVEIGNKAADNTVVKLSGNQTIAGTKTFSTSPVVPSKTTDATNTGTAIATEAQVYKVDSKVSSLFGLGKFLSLWNATTGLPDSFPLSTPYTYSTGDYFLVETVSGATPPVNYRPNGSSYTGTASSVVETDEVEVGDTYAYDGVNWLLQSNHGKTVTFANITGDPYDNANLATALNAKQDLLTAGRNIDLTSDIANLKLIEVTITTVYNTAAKIGTTAAGNYTPTVGDLLLVNFVNGCSVNNPTINIDGSGAKYIMVGGARASTVSFPCGSAAGINTKIIMYYDGTYYRSYGMFGGYASMTQAEIDAATSTGNRVINSVNLKYAVEKHAPVQTVNGQTGDVTVQEELESGVNIRTINGNSVLGSGDLSVGASLDEMTQAEYDALPISKESDGVWRLIYE